MTDSEITKFYELIGFKPPKKEEKDFIDMFNELLNKDNKGE